MRPPCAARRIRKPIEINSLDQPRIRRLSVNRIYQSPTSLTAGILVVMKAENKYPDIGALGENLRIARKRRGLRIVDLAEMADCSPDTLRRLESGDPGVSLGVLSRVMAAIDCTQMLASVLDAAEDAEGQKAQVQRLPQRVRLPLLPVERISQEHFWADKRARQANSYDRVASAEVSQSALFAFSDEQVAGAQFRWPKSGFSALEDENELEEHPASALRR